MSKQLAYLAVAAAVLMAPAWGCIGQSNEVELTPRQPQGAQAKHDHPEHGPHGGDLIELGNEEYHAELTHDDATGEVTIYVLDNKAKESVAIAEQEVTLNLVVDGQPRQIKLAAAPQPTDGENGASRFSVKDAEVVKALDAPKTTGRLQLSIDGKPYSGTIDHHEHD